MTPAPPLRRKRIGLALSGGGFRASIFHLGVIRRLEELEIMKDVDAISAVSGGSIVAAYYVCEMEQRLHAMEETQRADPAERVRIFGDIAEEFLRAVDHNLRTRALIYTPFFHPWLFLKTLVSRPFRTGARATLIQSEYDLWFYDGDTLDQFPSVTPDQVPPKSTVIYGPNLILNTTSLLTGERVAFSRVPISGMAALSRVNKNVLKISRVVGASSGVPVVFPPTVINGNALVDGGVCDNQGIEALVDDTPGETPCDTLLVSDASGQMESKDSVKTGETSVYARVNDILQFQVRAKLLKLLVQWQNPPAKSFAFVHLFLNLKDRPQVTNRVPSDYIPAIGRIRTDLDQFSYVEREALMYHGYTLIDAQIRQYCPELIAERFAPGAEPPLRTPPLFRDDLQRKPKVRDAMRRDLECGQQKLFLWRSARKYPGYVVPLLLAGVFAALLLFTLALYTRTPLLAVQKLIGTLLYAVPVLAQEPIERSLRFLGLPGLRTSIQALSGVLAFLGLLGLSLYLVSFPVYLVVHHMARRLDRRLYTKITGVHHSAHWKPAGE
ncbi:MAG: patatin-like phospholipase family protein [Bryobacteraceae bacterium]|jgi:predicted acylesterase/phospholipase RssA